MPLNQSRHRRRGRTGAGEAPFPASQITTKQHKIMN